MESYTKILSNLVEYLPPCNTFKGIMFYSFITYVFYLIMLRLTHKTDEEYEQMYDKELKKKNDIIEERRKIKAKEAKELLEKVSKIN
jgi:hypothetical protein